MLGPLSRRRATVIVAATAFAVAGVTGCAGKAPSSSSTTTAAGGGFHGTEPDRRPRRPSFVLTDLDGGTFDFKAETAGRPTYLYFGYTNCPDACPTAMADIAAALRQAPVADRDRVRVVMVTTDPARDTPAAMRRFLGQFSTASIGLVGTQEQVDAAQRAVGIDPAAKEGPIPTTPGRPEEHTHAPGTAPHAHSGPLGYSVGHADVIFAYDAADTLPVIYPGGSTPADIAADLPKLVRPGS